MFPKTVASESGARRDVLAEMAARIPPHAAETSQVDGGHRSKSETRSSSPTPPYHVTRGRGHRRTGLPRDRRASAVVIRTAHGRLRRPTARLAVLPTEVESSHAPTGGGLTAELRPPCAAVAASAD
ncbi:hypothetical protein EVAR_55033_1 [Eumeta japonica]|uniref:Uncharacterized protein n=1 Tax=Eumeta variegata TaxID=151549 RepID=A0A4C1ZTG6_EUMVA|nr:hypothetical protein EVAR_55033_1 [Eumeta japonica]